VSALFRYFQLLPRVLDGLLVASRPGFPGRRVSPAA